MKSKTIHYVDDDRDDIEYFKFAVDQLNSNITLHVHNSADSFLESCRRNEEKDPVIFLDINMPVKNGFDVLKAIRGHNDLKSLPVIMYSTSNDPVSVSISKDLGADLYAVKPVDINEVARLISKILGIEWSSAGLSGHNFVIN
jgi:CheY-like chemotaxis protein